MNEGARRLERWQADLNSNRHPHGDVEIRVQRFPSFIAIAMGVAPLVRRGVITDAEGSALVRLRYALRLAEIRKEEA